MSRYKLSISIALYCTWTGCHLVSRTKVTFKLPLLIFFPLFWPGLYRFFFFYFFFINAFLLFNGVFMAFYRLRSVSRPSYPFFLLVYPLLCFLGDFFRLPRFLFQFCTYSFQSGENCVWLFLKSNYCRMACPFLSSGAGLTLNVPSRHSWRPFGFFFLRWGLAVYNYWAFSCPSFWMSRFGSLVWRAWRSAMELVALVSDKAIMNVGWIGWTVYKVLWKKSCHSIHLAILCTVTGTWVFVKVKATLFQVFLAFRVGSTRELIFCSLCC